MKNRIAVLTLVLSLSLPSLADVGQKEVRERREPSLIERIIRAVRPAPKVRRFDELTPPRPTPCTQPC